MQHHTQSAALDSLPGWLALTGPVLLVAYACGAFSCGAAQRQTVEQAKAGLRLACDGLAFAVAEGKTIPGAELADRVCDVERTAAVMVGIVERAEGVRQIVTDPDWFDAQPSLAGARDAGAP